MEHWRWILALLQACDLLICFEDTSGPQLLTVTTLALSSWIFTCGVSNLFHITLEIRSLLIRTTLHFIFIATTLN